MSMAVPSFGNLEPAVTAVDKAPSPETPFRIAVLGDFAGHASRGQRRDAATLAKVKAVPVSRDTLDETMARLKVAVQLPLPDGEEVTLQPQSLDDFHPDEVHDKVEKFEDLSGDDEKSEAMRSLLHDPHFQEVEAAWRGLDWLLKRVHKVGSGIEVVLFDVSFDELSADLAASDNLTDTGVYRSLISPIVESAKAAPWALLVGLYTFDFTPEQLGVLGRIAKLAGVAAAPFIAASNPRVLDSSFELTGEAAATWQALRSLPEAALVGLTTPRFLMRQPFGENTKSIDKFSFEEVDPRQSKAGYLWGNPALGVACLLGMSFHKESWGFKTGGVLDLDDLPIHVWRDVDGDEQVTLAEAWLERKTTERLVKLGLMPFLSVRGKNALQLFRFVSLAQPPQGQPAVDLVGRWGQKGTLKVPRSMGVRGGGGISLVGGAPPAPPEKAAATDAAEEPPANAPAEEAPPAEDPELAALLNQLATPAETPAPAQEMDPELAALMAQLEGGSPPAAPEPAAAAAAEMDPELAALMAQLEGGGEAPAAAPVEESPPPASEPLDPELAALLQQLEGGDTPATQAPAEAPPAAVEDPELAALLQQLEGGGEPAPPAEAAPPAADLDPELAALLEQLESGGEPAPPPEPEPVPESPAADLRQEIERLGGRQRLDELGWPVFAPALLADLERTHRILEKSTPNRAVEKEVADLVKKCGGYPALAADGVRPGMHLNQQLAKLRDLRKLMESDALLNDDEAKAMADTYDANLKKAATPRAKSELLAQVREYDKWASDARNANAAAALEGCPFKERRQAMLEHQLTALGGDNAFAAAQRDHPGGLDAKAPAETRIAVLRALKEYTKLGGDAAFAKSVGNDPVATPLLTKAEQLKTVLAAKE